MLSESDYRLFPRYARLLGIIIGLPIGLRVLKKPNGDESRDGNPTDSCSYHEHTWAHNSHIETMLCNLANIYFILDIISFHYRQQNI